MATKRRTARRLRLRERVLLLVRALACAAVALALAKPFRRARARARQVTRGPQAAVLVIDDSFAVGLQVDGKPWIKRRDRARRANPRAARPRGRGRDRARVRRRRPADRADPRPPAAARSAAPARCDRAARRYHARARSRRAAARRVEPQRARPCSCCRCWPRTGLRPTSRRGARTARRSSSLDLRPARLPNARGHRAARRPRSGRRHARRRVRRRGRQLSAREPAKVELSLTIADRVVARGQLEIAPGERNTKRFLAALPRRRARGRCARSSSAATRSRSTTGAGVRATAARRGPRAARRRRSAHGAPRRRAVLSRGRAASGRSRRQRHAVRTITRRGARGARRVAHGAARPRRLRRRRARERRRAAAPIRSRCSPSGCAPAAASCRARRSRRSRRVRPHDAAAAAAERCAIRSTRRGVRRPGGSRQPRAAPREVGRRSPDLHAVLEGRAQLADAKFFKISLLGPTTAHGRRKVLARFTNGAAALVEASIGAGRTLLFTSTLDRDWNDLPIHPGFLPLMQQTVRYLARKHARDPVAASTSSAARRRCRPAISRARGPRAGQRRRGRSRATPSPAAARFVRAHRPARHLSRDRHRQDRRDAAARRARVRDQRRSARLGSDDAPPTRAAARRHRRRPAPNDDERRVELWHALAALRAAAARRRRPAGPALNDAETRRAYAEAVAPLGTRAVVDAFAAVPRERFVGDGPWGQLRVPGRGPRRFVTLTVASIGAHTNRDVLVAIDPTKRPQQRPAVGAREVARRGRAEARRLGAACRLRHGLLHRDPEPAASAISAPSSRTTSSASWVDRARANLAPWPRANVLEGDASNPREVCTT